MLNQSVGAVSRLETKRTIAKKFSLSPKEVFFSDEKALLSSLNGVSVIFDAKKELSWLVPKITGEKMVSFLPPTLTTDKQVIDLSIFNVQIGNLHFRKDASFQDGFTLNYSSESVLFNNIRYRWNGALPKVVDAGGEIKVSDISPWAWVAEVDARMPWGGSAIDALNKTVSLSAMGVKTDGTDQTIAFKNAISIIENLPGYWVLSGKCETVTVSQGIKIDLVKMGIEEICVKYQYPAGTPSANHVFIMEVEGSNVASALPYKKPVFRNVHVVGAANRDKNPVHAYKFAPSSNLANLVVDNCSSRQTYSSVVFGTNAYLIKFDNFTPSGFVVGLTDTVALGIETSITNAGENVRFFGGVFANSTSLIDFKGFEVTMSFFGTSLDYTGDPLGVNVVQIRLRRQGITLNFNNCHFESGNENAGITTNYIEAESSVAVNIVGGWMVFGNTTYNDAPFFFYDKSGGKSSFSLDGTRLFGLGIKRWSNVVPDKFMPVINYDASVASAKITDQNYLLTDPSFKVDAIPDLWHASGTRTSRLESEQIKLERVVTQSAGADVSALKITRKSGASNAIARLIFEAPTNAFRATVTLKIKADTKVTLPTAIFFTLIAFKESPINDAFGVPTPVLSKTFWEVGLKDLNTDMTEVTINGSLLKDAALLGFRKFILAINVNGTGSAGVDTVYITDVIINKPF